MVFGESGKNSEKCSSGNTSGGMSFSMSFTGFDRCMGLVAPLTSNSALTLKIMWRIYSPDKEKDADGAAKVDLGLVRLRLRPRLTLLKTMMNSKFLLFLMIRGRKIGK